LDVRTAGLVLEHPLEYRTCWALAWCSCSPAIVPGVAFLFLPDIHFYKLKQREAVVITTY